MGTLEDNETLSQHIKLSTEEIIGPWVWGGLICVLLKFHSSTKKRGDIYLKSSQNNCLDISFWSKYFRHQSWSRWNYKNQQIWRKSEVGANKGAKKNVKFWKEWKKRGRAKTCLWNELSIKEQVICLK